MGEFLSVPNKEKVSEDGESTKVNKLPNNLYVNLIILLKLF